MIGYLASADSIAINFYLPGTNNVERVGIIRDTNQIRNFARLLSKSKKTNSNCMAEGDLHFFDNSQVVFSADFATDSCRYISYSFEEETYTTDLGKEATQLLQLEKNKK